MASANYYDTLKIEKNASINDIKTSYKKLAKEFHPDKNKSPDAEEKFKKIAEAYETLSDPNKRKMYDMRQFNPNNGNPNINNIFKHMFNFNINGMNNATTHHQFVFQSFNRPRNINHKYDAELLDIYLNKTAHIQVIKNNTKKILQLNLGRRRTVFHGMGEHGGSLTVNVEPKVNNKFSIKNNHDLQTTHTISLYEYYSKNIIEMTHIDNTTVEFPIELNKFDYIIENKGLIKNNVERGKLFITLKIHFNELSSDVINQLK